MALCLGLIAQEQRPTVGLPDHAVEAAADGRIEASGEETGLEAIPMAYAQCVFLRVHRFEWF